MLEKLTDISIETQRKWLRFMLERVGQNNLPGLLDYYKSIGWLGIPAANRLLDLAGQEKRYKGTSWTLSAEEHRISRLYIEKLKGRQVDESLLSAPAPGKATPELEKKVEIKVRKPVQSIHPADKKKMEFTIHRREVTIKNLEEELEEKDAKIDELKDKIRELEGQLEEYSSETKRNNIFMGLFDQNTRLRKASFTGKRGSGKK